jgi:hypothetical protein
LNKLNKLGKLNDCAALLVSDTQDILLKAGVFTTQQQRQGIEKTLALAPLAQGPAYPIYASANVVKTAPI